MSCDSFALEVLSVIGIAFFMFLLAILSALIRPRESTRTMPTIEEQLDDDELSEIKEAEEQSKKEKAAAKRRAKRAETKYGLMLEDDDE